MEKKLTLDRKEDGTAFFIDENKAIYCLDASLVPSVREGDICILHFDEKGVFTSCEVCEKETKAKKAQMRSRLFGLFKNKK